MKPQKIISAQIANTRFRHKAKCLDRVIVMNHDGKSLREMSWT